MKKGGIVIFFIIGFIGKAQIKGNVFEHQSETQNENLFDGVSVSNQSESPGAPPNDDDDPTLLPVDSYIPFLFGIGSLLIGLAECSRQNRYK